MLIQLEMLLRQEVEKQKTLIREMKTDPGAANMALVLENLIREAEEAMQTNNVLSMIDIYEKLQALI